jgi:2-dehydro-3-deoxygalactonokinase
LSLERHVPFLSCDWGTSSFRLRLVSDGKVEREIREPSGVRSLYEKSLENKSNRAALFANFLRAKATEINGEREGLPLVISGMASSTIGWRELPYARVPFGLDGSGLFVEKMEWEPPAAVGKTLLISGAATDDDVMRGEEIQLLGIMASPERAAFAQRCVLILPGTHSKHIHIKGRSVQTFRTYMTGELFEVLARHSILRATVDGSVTILPDEAFYDGLATARDRGLDGSLFSARARGVLGNIPAAKNAAFLSGVLIGSELSHLDGTAPVLIAGAGSLAELYAATVRKIAPNIQFQMLSPAELDRATVSAHELILSRFL